MEALETSWATGDIPANKLHFTNTILNPFNFFVLFIHTFFSKNVNGKEYGTRDGPEQVTRCHALLPKFLSLPSLINTSASRQVHIVPD
jgi:hypothetical protein